MLSKDKFNKYLKIENNTVIAKAPIRIDLDLSEYKNISEEFDTDNDSGIAETANGVYEIPGFFTLEILDNDKNIVDSIQFFFPYNVYLLGSNNSEISSTRFLMEYEEGDSIFFAKFKKQETDIRILDKLFENGIKYLSTRMDFLIYNIWKQVEPTINVPWHHFEVIVSQLYGKRVEGGHYVPLRLTNEEYSKKYALNTKQAAHYFGESSGFLYGYSNDALLTSVSKDKTVPKKYRPDYYMEKLIAGEVNEV